MSNSSWIASELPPGWASPKFRDICDVVRGGSPRPMGDPRFFGGAIPFLKIADVTRSDGVTVYDTETKVTPEGAQRSRLLPAGQLVLTNSATVCVPIFLGVDACIHDGFVAFDGLPDFVDNKFLYYFFKYIRPYVLDEHKQGVTQVNLNTGIVGDMSLLLPPPNEQRRIVARIEELFSELDKGVENLTTAREQLKAYRLVLLKHAFEGKLTREWRARNQVGAGGGLELLARIASARQAGVQTFAAKADPGSGTNLPCKPLKPKRLTPLSGKELEALGDLPTGWCWAKIGDVACVGTGVTPLKSRPEYYDSGDIPWTTSGALNEPFVRLPLSFITQRAYEETNLRLFPAHTLLIALYGEGKTRGKCSELLFDSTTNQAISAIVMDEAASGLRRFIKWFLTKNYEAIRMGSSGGVQPNLNNGIIENLPVPICSLLEAQETVELIESKTSRIDDLAGIVDGQITKTLSLRRSILRAAFSGQLVPQDPRDEPALVSLERIRSAREESCSPKSSSQCKEEKK